MAYMCYFTAILHVGTSQKYIQCEILSFFFFVTLDSIFSGRHQDKQQEEDKIKQFQGLRFDLIWWKKTHYTIPNIQPNFFLHLSSILYSLFPFFKKLTSSLFSTYSAMKMVFYIQQYFVTKQLSKYYLYYFIRRQKKCNPTGWKICVGDLKMI